MNEFPSNSLACAAAALEAPVPAGLEGVRRLLSRSSRLPVTLPRSRRYSRRLSPDEEDAWAAWSVRDSENDEGFMVGTWRIAGVHHPDDIPVGLSPVDLIKVRQWLGVDPEPGWAGLGLVCFVTAGRLWASGKPPQEVVALAAALPRPDGLPYAPDACLPGRCPSREVVAAVLACGPDLNWPDLTCCLTAGLSLDEALAHVRSGRDMRPVRVMAALG